MPALPTGWRGRFAVSHTDSAFAGCCRRCGAVREPGPRTARGSRSSDPRGRGLRRVFWPGRRGLPARPCSVPGPRRRTRRAQQGRDFLRPTLPTGPAWRGVIARWAVAGGNLGKHAPDGVFGLRRPPHLGTGPANRCQEPVPGTGTRNVPKVRTPVRILGGQGSSRPARATSRARAALLGCSPEPTGMRTYVRESGSRPRGRRPEFTRLGSREIAERPAGRCLFLGIKIAGRLLRNPVAWWAWDADEGTSRPGEEPAGRV